MRCTVNSGMEDKAYVLVFIIGILVNQGLAGGQIKSGNFRINRIMRL